MKSFSVLVGMLLLGLLALVSALPVEGVSDVHGLKNGQSSSLSRVSHFLGLTSIVAYDRSDVVRRDPEVMERGSSNCRKKKCPKGEEVFFNYYSYTCRCRPAHPKRDQIPEAPCPVARALAKRLLAGPRNYTSISLREWTAISASIYLLEDQIEDQEEFHDICTGKTDPQAFGFDLKVFRRLCHPEITVPVPESVTRQADRRIDSVKWAMLFLHKNEDDKMQACGNLKNSTSVPKELDKPYMSSLLCKKKGA